MASEVQICNLALSHLGDRGQITLLTENSREAFHCNFVYETARDALLRAYAWRFATKYQALADLGSPPSPWLYRYAYPQDCLKARALVNPAAAVAATPGTVFFSERSTYYPGEMNEPVPFEIAAGDNLESRVILTDLETATLEYTAAVTNPAAFPPDFTLTLSWFVAMEVAIPLSGNQKLYQQAAAGFQAALLRASAQDAGEGYRSRSHTPDWLAARG